MCGFSRPDTRQPPLSPALPQVVQSYRESDSHGAWLPWMECEPREVEILGLDMSDIHCVHMGVCECTHVSVCDCV